MDPDTQAVQWRFAQTQGLNTPAYDQGQLFFTGRQSGIYCINASTGALVWQVNDGLPFYGSVTLDDTRLYIMAQTGKVEARLRSNGDLVWSYQTGSFSSSNVGICNGIVVAASDDRYLRAFDGATGKILWQRGFGGNFARMAPILICGVVYISGCANELYGIELGSGKTIWAFCTNASNSFTDIAVE
jgi:outer membrane protein assembly factor BamB